MDISIFLLLLSGLLLMGLLFFTLTVKRKSMLYYVFLAVLVGMMIWIIGNVLAWYTYIKTGQFVIKYVKLWYIGNCYIPVLLYLTGTLFTKNISRFTWRQALLFVPPSLSYLALLTNEANGGLFFKYFSIFNTDAVFGPFFYFHSLVSYVYIGLAIYHFLSFSIRSTGLFSRQSLMTLTAILCPVVVNLITTLRLGRLPAHGTTIAFTFTVAMFFLAIIKYQFLNVRPLAMQTIFDRMTDGFIVIDENDRINYCSKAFIETFKSVSPKLMSNICDLFKSEPLYTSFAEILEDYISMVKQSGRSFSFDQWLSLDEHDERYFQVDVTPISGENNSLWGMLILFKDTTQIHKANETIRKNQTMLLEQQHLATLGQMIGGIAHNLRTPIMSIAGGLESLKDLIQEYQISIGDKTVTDEDHREIAAEMLSWIEKTKPFCSYMSDIISTVKDQTVRLNESSMHKFTVSELLKRVDLLMLHELKKGHCTLHIDNRLTQETEIPGTMNNMIQILANIIVNAIEAYEDQTGRIELKVDQCPNIPGNLHISITDYGAGIPEEIRERVFKEMITTKGSKGTGLGLYMSYLTIKGKFGGHMWFQTQTGRGTTFHLSIPIIQPGLTGGNSDEKKTV